MSNVRIRSIALPTEHGGWGFISEPILLGLLIAPLFTAPSWAGFLFSVAAFAAFLTRQPLKIFMKDALKRRFVPRTTVAGRFLALYSGVALIAFVGVLLLSPDTRFLLPLVMAAPLFAVQLYYDSQNQSRAAIAELMGAAATGSIASGIVLLNGWELLPALALWLALAVKGVTAVMYVRARLRIERDQPAPVTAALILHAAGVLILSGAYFAGYLPLTAPLAMLILAFRAALGLSTWRKPRPAKAIGFQEIGYGLLFVVLVAAGFYVSVGMGSGA